MSRKMILVMLTAFVANLFSMNAYAHNHAKTVNSKADGSMAASALISDTWARATFALAKTGAAYFIISNSGDKAILIKSISISPKFAMSAELHHTVMKNDMMQMRELDDGVRIEPEETVEFSPGAKHIMIMGLRGPLIKGKELALTIHFEDGSRAEHLFSILDKRD